ncbi:hypothetical protein D3C75_807850 [compost metagenome]
MNADGENVGADYIGHIGDNGVLEVIHLIEANLHDPSHGQNGHQGNDRQNAGQGHMPDLLQLARPVKGGGFVQMGIDAPYCRQVDNGAEAGFLPDAGAEEDGQPRAGLVQECDRLAAKLDDQGVDGSGLGAEQGHHDAADNNPGEKVGHIQKRLHRFLQPCFSDLIEHNRDKNRKRKADDNGQQADHKGVADDQQGLGIAEDHAEIIQPGPGAAEHPLHQVILLEGNNIAQHGHVFEGNEEGSHRQKHQDQRHIPPQPSFGSPFKGGSRNRAHRPACTGLYSFIGA